MTTTIATLNQLSQAEFVATLGSIFEDTPAIASQTWHQRPFQTVDELHQQMVAVVEALSPEAQLELIQAHPDLGSRLKMAEASVQEQACVGFDRLTPEEYDRFHHLNQSYKAKFGFPFIIAVRNHTRATILAAFERRLEHTAEAEKQQALAEIYQIARFRLTDALAP